MQITLEKIRENLVRAIKESDLSQTELAKQLKIAQPTIAQYISGRALPSLDTLANLCKIIDVSPAYILCFEDEFGNKTSEKTYNNYGVHTGDVKF